MGEMEVTGQITCLTQPKYINWQNKHSKLKAFKTAVFLSTFFHAVLINPFFLETMPGEVPSALETLSHSTIH